jgi:HK97 family phage portal protein
MRWPFSRKAQTYSIDQLAQLVSGWIGYGTIGGGVVNEATALEVPAVLAAARVIAEGMGQMPIRLMAQSHDGERLRRVVAHEHWAHRLLAVRPNHWQTPFEFVEGMTFGAVLGRGSIAIKNVVGGEVRELLPVPGTAWSVEQLADWSLLYRVDYADKTHDYFGQGQVLHLRGPALNGYEGLPAVRAAREAIGLTLSLERQQAGLAANGGKPSGILSFPNGLSEESREKLARQWKEKFGFGGQGGIALLDQDTKFTGVTMTSIDAQFLDTRRFQIEEIGRAFRVLPMMLMQSDKTASFASWEQMLRMHITHTLGPWEVRWEQALNRDVLGHAPNLAFDMDERQMLRGDFKDQAEYYTKALGAGGQPAWMTQNEIREEVGLNPIDTPEANRLSPGAMAPAAAGDAAEPGNADTTDAVAENEETQA